MISGIGTDITEVKRIKEAIEKYGERFLNRIFTKSEQEYCDSFNDNRFEHYTARFAAKESFSKAIGTGLTQGFKFTEISIENKESGEPYVVFTGGMKEKYFDFDVFISLSHTNDLALAYVILQKT